MKVPTGGIARERKRPHDPVKLRGRQSQSGWEKVPSSGRLRSRASGFSARASAYATLPSSTFSAVSDNELSNRLIDDQSASAPSGPNAASELDREVMNKARDLARLGSGRTGPNPIVGAVVMRDAREVGAGYHRRHGEAHAEVVALDQAGEAARGATLYVTLEPCAHQGRTPPCVDRIVDSGVVRVVCPALDPDPRVRGRGIDRLRAAGIRVDVGCLADAAMLDAIGFYRDRLGIPTTVSLKMAVSADGMVAREPGRRDDVTEAASRADGHALRALHDAVVVGVETVRIDRPRLDCRLLAQGVDRDPTPVVLDSDARTPLDSEWARARREFVVVCAPDADPGRIAALERAGAGVLRARRGAVGLDIHEVLRALQEIGLRRILVEGGPRVFWSFVDAGAWDAAWLYRSERVFGPAGVPLFRAAGEAFPGRAVDERTLGGDRRLGFVNQTSWTRMTTALERARS